MSSGLRLARQDIVANHARVGRSQVPYVYTRPQERTSHSSLYDLGGLAGVTAQGDHYPWVELRAERGSEAYRKLGCKIHVELTRDYAALEDRTQAHCLVYKAPGHVSATLDGLVRKYLNFRGDSGTLADDDVVAQRTALQYTCSPLNIGVTPDQSVHELSPRADHDVVGHYGVRAHPSTLIYTDVLPDHDRPLQLLVVYLRPLTNVDVLPQTRPRRTQVSHLAIQDIPLGAHILLERPYVLPIILSHEPVERTLILQKLREELLGEVVLALGGNLRQNRRL